MLTTIDIEHKPSFTRKCLSINLSYQINFVLNTDVRYYYTAEEQFFDMLMVYFIHAYVEEFITKTNSGSCY